LTLIVVAGTLDAPLDEYTTQPMSRWTIQPPRRPREEEPLREQEPGTPTGTYEQVKQQPIFKQIIAQIQNRIVHGVLKPGDVLPPERLLSEMIGVSRHSLRQALKVLEHMGVVTSKAGIGTILNNPGQDFLLEQLNKLVDFSPANLLTELMELRQILEPGIAALAAKRATQEDLSAMRRAMEEFEKEFRDGRECSDADERLHVSLAVATHNSTLVRLTNPIMVMLGEYREKALQLEGRRLATYQEHERIFRAVRERQPEEAKNAMADHLLHVEAAIRAVGSRSDS
jgi:GntR family transcriptional repressor for pyruvate dehydrogenase complex